MPKISQLSDSYTTPFTGNEVVPILQDGSTYQTSISNLPFLGLNNLIVPDDSSSTLTLGDGSDPGSSSNFYVQSPTASVLLYVQADPDNPDNDQVSVSVGSETNTLNMYYDGGASSWLTNIQGWTVINQLTIGASTPAGSDDEFNSVGDIRWDDDNLYIYTNNGWAYAPLTLMDPIP